MTSKSRFVLILEAGRHKVPASARLKAALKILARTFGLRCVSIREERGTGK